jgi:hypothetical protein
MMKTNSGAGKWSIVIVVAVVVIIVIIVAVVAFGNHGAAPTATQTSAQQPSASAASYTSPNDSFAVNFPTAPQVTNTTYNSPSAGEISLTTYESAASSSVANAHYVVMVYHYPASYQFSADYLAGALQVFGTTVNAKYPGTSVTDQTPTQFLGASAITALVTVPVDGATTDDYVLITTKGQNTYVLDTYGMTQSDFNAFIGSFSFTQ